MTETYAVIKLQREIRRLRAGLTEMARHTGHEDGNEYDPDYYAAVSDMANWAQTILDDSRRPEYEKCDRCGTIKAFTCRNCNERIHPYYSGTLAGSAMIPWWHDDDDAIQCKDDSIHSPTCQEPDERYEI